MISESYDDLDWYFEGSFQPPMESCWQFDFFKWNKYMGIQFGPGRLFIMDVSEVIDIDTWVHEFVEVAVAEIITDILELEPLEPILVHMFDERIGWWHVCFCHLLAALTTGQGWWDEDYNNCIMESDEVWQYVESSLEHIKNGLKYEAGNNE
jgi:hypothetical protein